MRSHIKLGRVFGIEIGIHSSWFIIAWLITFSLAARFRSVDRDWSAVLVWGAALATAILFFASLLAHELAHSLVARASCQCEELPCLRWVASLSSRRRPLTPGPSF